MAKIPDLIKLSPTDLENTAVSFDTQGYNASDADYAKRFPELVAGRDSSIANANANLSGVQDPIYNSVFKQSGLGPLNLGNTSFQQSKNLGQPILAKEQRDRNYFETLFAANPSRTFGLSPGDEANIALANSGAQTQFNAATVGSKINELNAQTAQNAALASTIGGIAGKTVSAGIGGLTQPTTSTDPFLTPNYYGGVTNYAGNYGFPQYGTGGTGDYSSPPTDFGSSYDYTSGSSTTGGF